jgi:hypothetical protein
MNRWLIPLVALILFAPACADDVYLGPPEDTGGTVGTTPESPTRQALHAWVRALPQSGKAAVTWYDVREEKITMHLNGDKTRVRRSQVRMLCRRLAHTLPIGTAKHVVLVAGLYSSGHRLASIRAGGTCHTRPTR